MANTAAIEAVALKDQGIRSKTNIEWIKVTIAGKVATDTITYTWKKIKTLGGVTGTNFPYAVSGKTITFTMPHDIAAGTFFIGLVEG